MGKKGDKSAKDHSESSGDESESDFKYETQSQHEHEPPKLRVLTDHLVVIYM